MRTTRLTHVAMSVPVGTLTTEFRTQIEEFYGELFGWHDLENLSNPERMTIATGGGSYINVKERVEPAAMTYEHFGVAVATAADVRAVADDLRRLGVEPENITGKTLLTLRFHHLLPMAIEVQNLP